MISRRTLGIISASIALLAAGAQPIFAADTGVAVGGGLSSIGVDAGLSLDADVSPAAKPWFGSDLSSKPYPNEVGGNGPQTCDESPTTACTRVMTQAYGNGILKAPQNGVIDKIQIIALDDGSARLFMARLDPNDSFRAKVTRKGPSFDYQGQPDSGPTFVNTIDIPDMTVLKGEVIAIKAVKFSGERGGSGGNRHLEFQPGLTVAEGYRTADDDNSYHLLVRAIYR